LSEEKKICGLCHEEIEKGTGFWLHPNILGIKYVHQICYSEHKELGKQAIMDGGLKRLMDRFRK